MRSRPRTLISAGLVTGLVLASGVATLLPGTATRAAAQALPPYASCDALLAHYRAELERTAVPYGLGGGGTARLAVAEQAAGGDTAADSAVAAPLPAAADAPTGTNLQEAGVDEPDTAKTVGGLLFAVSDRGLEVVRAGAQPEQLGHLPLEGQSWGAELLVDGDRVLVLAPGYGPVGLAGDEPMGRLSMPVAGRTSVLLVDVADPTRPRLLERLELDGRYLSARLSGGSVRLVTTSTPVLRGVQPQEPYGPAEEAAALLATLPGWLHGHVEVREFVDFFDGRLHRPADQVERLGQLVLRDAEHVPELRQRDFLLVAIEVAAQAERLVESEAVF